MCFVRLNTKSIWEWVTSKNYNIIHVIFKGFGFIKKFKLSDTLFFKRMQWKMGIGHQKHLFYVYCLYKDTWCLWKYVLSYQIQKWHYCFKQTWRFNIRYGTRQICYSVTSENEYQLTCVTLLLFCIGKMRLFIKNT